MSSSSTEFALIDALPDATFVVDREWRFVHLNRRALKVATVPLEQLVGRSLWETFPVLLGTAFEALYRDTVVDGVPREAELFVERSNVWYRTSVAPFAGGLLVQYRDVTSRHRMDDELRARAEWRRQLIENLPIGAAYLENGRLNVNRAMERISGYTRHELSSLDAWFEALHPGTSNEARRRYERARDSGFRAPRITSFRRKDGEERLVEFTGSLVGDQEVWVVEDVTERLRAERALQQSELRYRQLLEQASDGIVIIDPSGRFTAANERALEMLGLPRERASMTSVTDVLLPEDLTSAPARIRRLESGESLLSERFLRRADGSLLAVEISSRRLPDGSVQGIIRDISQRRRAEEALRESELALQAVIHATPLAIETMDLEGNVQIWNPAAESMFGWSAEEVVGLPDPTTPPDLAEEEAALFDAERAGLEVSGLETRRRRKDGRTIDVQVSSAPLRDAAGEIRGVVSVISDVTERKRLEQQLLQAQKMDAIGRLAGGVAHDFNNLLTAITAYSDLLLSSLDERDPRREEVREIHSAAQRGAGLTRQLLSFSRKQVVQPQVVTTDSVVASLASLMRRLIGEDIELVLRTTTEGACVKVDPGQLEQAVVNLVVNARDAMPKGGRVTLETACIDVTEPILHPHGFVRPGAWVVISVADTGCGMTPEVMSHLFEPFFTTKGPGKGTGLGLSTVYGIVKQSGGHVLVESTPAAGSVFRLYFPRERDADVARHASHDTEGRPGGAETVLLVEDEEAVRSAVRRILESAGYRVLCASNGVEALAVADAHGGEVGLLMTDVIMPQMGGRELVERLTTRHRGLKALYISGYVGDAVPDREALGPHAYLQKPFTTSVILEKVREVLDS
jgi:two-component system cell cycle sensor histidine kinase/response regulator CckA